MSYSLRHCSLDQLQLFSASLIKDITPLVVADKLRYAIPINWQNKEVFIYDTRSLPKDVLASIGKVRLEPSNEIVVTMNSSEIPQTPSEFTTQPDKSQRVSARYPGTQPSFIYFRHSKVVSDTDSETHFVIEFETIDGEPITLWETQAFQEHIHLLLKAIKFHKFNWETAGQQAQILLEAEFSVDEIERLTQRSIEVETETHAPANQTRKEESCLRENYRHSSQRAINLPKRSASMRLNLCLRGWSSLQKKISGHLCGTSETNATSS